MNLNIVTMSSALAGAVIAGLTGHLWMALSPSQRYAILMMHASNGISYDDQRDRTMMALQRRGLVRFQRRAKYGRNCWHLTEAGTGEAARRLAQKARLAKSDERALLREIMR
jgi:hypothetical protein